MEETPSVTSGYLTTLSESRLHNIDDMMNKECGAFAGLRITKESRRKW
jgi:hypothetical protein